MGEVKRTREGKKNTMWKVSNSRNPELEHEYDGSSSSSSTSSPMLRMSSSSLRGGGEGRKNYKNPRRSEKRKTKLSGPSMLGSGVVRQGGGYKNMKRKEKRKQRRSMSHGLDDYYGLR